MLRSIVSEFAKLVRLAVGGSVNYEAVVWVERLCVAGIGFQSVLCVALISAFAQYNKSESPFKLIEIYDFISIVSIGLLFTIFIHTWASHCNKSWSKKYETDRWMSTDLLIVFQTSLMSCAVGALMFFIVAMLSTKMLAVACREIEPGELPAGSGFCRQLSTSEPIQPLERRPVPILVPTP